MATHSLFLLPGDGIGTEIMAEVEKLIAHLNGTGVWPAALPMMPIRWPSPMRISPRPWPPMR